MDITSSDFFRQMVASVKSHLSGDGSAIGRMASVAGSVDPTAQWRELADELKAEGFTVDNFEDELKRRFTFS